MDAKTVMLCQVCTRYVVLPLQADFQSMVSARHEFVGSSLYETVLEHQRVGSGVIFCITRVLNTHSVYHSQVLAVAVTYLLAQNTYVVNRRIGMLDGDRFILHEVCTIADHHARGSAGLLIMCSRRTDHSQTVLKNQFRQQSYGIQNLAIGSHHCCCATYNQGAMKTVPVGRGKSPKNSGGTSPEMSSQTSFNYGGGPYFHSNPLDVHVKNRLFLASNGQRGVLL